MSKQKEETITIRINKDLKEKYKTFCDDNGLSLSKRLRIFIETELNHNLKKSNNDFK